jgi:hypothetical protein
VNITSSLLTVQPTDQTIDAGLAKSLASIPGVAQVSPQRIVPLLVDGQVANVIAFDPAHDSSILTWLERRQPTPLGAEGIIVGHRRGAQLGQQLSVCGMFVGPSRQDGVWRGGSHDPAAPIAQQPAHAVEHERIVVDHDDELAARHVGYDRRCLVHLDRG